jgi:hypothetical protein
LEAIPPMPRSLPQDFVGSGDAALLDSGDDFRDTKEPVFTGHFVTGDFPLGDVLPARWQNGVT